MSSSPADTTETGNLLKDTIRSMMETRMRMGVEKYGHGIRVEDTNSAVLMKKWLSSLGSYVDEYPGVVGDIGWNLMAIEECLDMIVYRCAHLARDFVCTRGNNEVADIIFADLIEDVLDHKCDDNVLRGMVTTLNLVTAEVLEHTNPKTDIWY